MYYTQKEKECIDNLLHLIANIQLVILFGSRLKGKLASDIDLIIVSNSNLDKQLQDSINIYIKESYYQGIFIHPFLFNYKAFLQKIEVRDIQTLMFIKYGLIIESTDNTIKKCLFDIRSEEFVPSKIAINHLAKFCFDACNDLPLERNQFFLVYHSICQLFSILITEKLPPLPTDGLTNYTIKLLESRLTNIHEIKTVMNEIAVYYKSKLPWDIEVQKHLLKNLDTLKMTFASFIKSNDNYHPLL